MTSSTHNLRIECHGAGLGDSLVERRISLFRLGDGRANGNVDDEIASCALPDVEIAPLLADVACLRRAPVEPVPAGVEERVGRQLAHLLLPPGIRYALLRESGAANGPLRLWLDLDPHLAALPWELLYLDDAAPNDPLGSRPVGFAAIGRRLHILRGSGAQPPVKPLEVDRVRILVATANPRSAAFGHLPAADAEIRAVRAAASLVPSEFETLLDATPTALCRAIERFKPHVLHFIGHGVVRPSGGALVLQSAAEGGESLVYADELAAWLRAAPVGLVHLSACDTGSPVGGLAATLAGVVPAVLCMQSTLRDSAAALFARAFYSALLEPCPIEEALGEGRQAIRGVGPDWSTPALYLTRDSAELIRRTSTTAAKPPPTNLPARKNPFFVGREDVLREIHEALPHAPVAVFGTTGLGKSLIATEYAHAHTRHYPGGIFWLKASEARLLREEYATVGRRYFGVREDDGLEDAVARTIDHLQSLTQPALLILDGLVNDDDLILPVTGPCRVLITTRLSHLFQQGFHPVKPPLLPMQEALALLQTHVKAGSEADLEAAREIASRLDCLPYALALVARHVSLQGLTFAQYAGELKALLGRRELATIRDAIDLAFTSLTTTARTTLRAASCFAPNSIPVNLLFEGTELPSRAAFMESVLLLERHSLVNRDRDGRLTMHGLVRLYVHQKSPRRILCSLAGRIAGLLAAALERSNSAMDWHEVRRELPHARAAVSLCRDLSAPSSALDLLKELGRYAFEHSDYMAARDYFQEGLSIAVRQHGRDSLVAAGFLQKLGETQQQLGRDAEARKLVREAWSVARRLGLRDPSAADFLNSVGYVLKIQGQYRRALPHYRRALSIYSEHGLQRDKAMCLNNMGMLLLALDDESSRDEMMECLTGALHIVLAVEGENHVAAAIYHNNVGQALQKHGLWQEALAHHDQAARINELAYDGSHPDLAASLYYAAESHRHLGNLAACRPLYERALEIYIKFYGDNDRRAAVVRSRLKAIQALETAAQPTNPAVLDC